MGSKDRMRLWDTLVKQTHWGSYRIKSDGMHFNEKFTKINMYAIYVFIFAVLGTIELPFF